MYFCCLTLYFLSFSCSSFISEISSVITLQVILLWSGFEHCLLCINTHFFPSFWPAPSSPCSLLCFFGLPDILLVFGGLMSGKPVGAINYTLHRFQQMWICCNILDTMILTSNLFFWSLVHTLHFLTSMGALNAS